MMRITPIAASSPLIMLDGKNADKAPARESPKMTWKIPPTTTANVNDSNEPSDAIWAATMAVRPAAGPVTLVCEPLKEPTTMPPMMPAISPENSGAPDANAIPRHSGNATRNTISPAVRSLGRVVARFLNRLIASFFQVRLSVYLWIGWRLWQADAP